MRYHEFAMIALGIAVTAATVTVLVAGFFRTRRRRPFPVYGWLGIVALAGAEWLMFAGIEPVATYFTPIAWSAYILIADAAVLALTGRSRLNDAPITVARMALLSIPLWLIFEAYNLRLRNWTYVGVPGQWPAALLGYGLSFATITPAIFETADLVQALLPPLPGTPWKLSSRTENVLIVCGFVCLVLPLVLPQRIAAYLFALIWVGFLLLLDPLNRKLGLRRLLEMSRRAFGGGFMDLWARAGSAAGCGNSGITGPRRSGTTCFRCSSIGKFSRCPRRDSLDSFPLRSNASRCTLRRPGWSAG